VVTLLAPQGYSTSRVEELEAQLQPLQHAKEQMEAVKRTRNREDQNLAQQLHPSQQHSITQAADVQQHLASAQAEQQLLSQQPTAAQQQERLQLQQNACLPQQHELAAVAGGLSAAAELRAQRCLVQGLAGPAGCPAGLSSSSQYGDRAGPRRNCRWQQQTCTRHRRRLAPCAQQLAEMKEKAQLLERAAAAASAGHTLEGECYVKLLWLNGTSSAC